MADRPRQPGEAGRTPSSAPTLRAVAHEILNALAAARLDASLLSADARGEVTLPVEERIEVLSEVESTLVRIERIVVGLRALSRVDVPPLASFQLEPLVRRVIDAVPGDPGVPRPPVALRVEPSAAGAAPGSGAAEVEQALLRILENAFEAAGPTGRVEVTIRRESPELVVEVRDSGPGIAPAVRDRLFEPMIGTRKERGGAGMGLAVARHVLGLVGGSVDAIDVEAGACFVIRITDQVPEGSAPNPQLTRRSSRRRGDSDPSPGQR